MNGNKIGEFGQDTHWKLDAIVAAEEEGDEEEKENQEEASLFKVSTASSSRSTT